MLILTQHNMEPWHIWVIIGLVLVILEIFTSGFAIICVSFGAFGGAIAAGCSLDLKWQIIIFAIVTAVAFIFIRPLLLKYFYKNKEAKVQTNADALIGREVVVCETIDKDAGTGRVKIDGDEWKAVAEEESGEEGKKIVIEKGTKVTVVSRDSIILTVKIK